MNSSSSWGLALWLCFCLPAVVGTAAQSRSPKPDSSNAASQPSKLTSAKALESEFFTLLRSGNANQVLDYVSEGGLNVGSNAQHVTRKEIEDQLTHHEGLYCKLFESGCIQSQIQLDDRGVRQCSYRELLTSSKTVRAAATETTRNGVRQAILIAEVKNDSCAGVGLIDFIFNAQSDGWKLFSIP